MDETILTREIDSVDWVKYFHAYGKSKDTPGHLHDLLRGERLDEAVRHLDSAVVHQGTVWPASPDALRLTCDILLTRALPTDTVDAILEVLAEASEVLRAGLDESAEPIATPRSVDEWLIDAAVRTRDLAPHVLATLDGLGDRASTEAIQGCREAWLSR